MSPTSGVPTRMVRAANMLTIPIAAPGASGTSRAAAAKHGANGNPAAKPTTAAAAIASGSGFAIASTATPPPPTRKLSRSRPRCPARRPPSGREATPAKSVRPPAIPATCSESPPARWRSVTTQLPRMHGQAEAMRSASPPRAAAGGRPPSAARRGGAGRSGSLGACATSSTPASATITAVPVRRCQVPTTERARARARPLPRCTPRRGPGRRVHPIVFLM